MMPELKIVRAEAHGQAAFVIADAPGHAPEYLAELTYRVHEGVMTILHTGVREALRGQGIARRLVDAAIEFARAEGLKVNPQCSYAAQVFEAHAHELADLQVT